MDRRTFIARAAGAGLAFCGAGVIGWRLRHLGDAGEPVSWDPSAFPPPGEARVAVLRAASYEADLAASLHEALREIGVDVSGARVLLKPNLVEFDPGSAVNTDPRLIAAAATALRRLGASSVTVGEGPGHRRDTGYVVVSSGLAEILGSIDVPFVDLNSDAVRAVRLRSGYTALDTVALPTSVVDADVVVSMPKMKTHHWVGITASLKNCFGCLPGRVYGWPKNALHWAGVEESILDVAGAVRPSVAIVDGIVGMEGNGPINGESKHVGVVIVGNDPVATDVTTARVMGFDPQRFPYLVEAGRFLGVGDPDRIKQMGEDPESVATTFEAAPGFTAVSGAGY